MLSCSVVLIACFGLAIRAQQMVLPNIFNNPEFWITAYLVRRKFFLLDDKPDGRAAQVDQGTHTVTAPGLIWKGVDVNLTACV